MSTANDNHENQQLTDQQVYDFFDSEEPGDIELFDPEDEEVFRTVFGGNIANEAFFPQSMRECTEIEIGQQQPPTDYPSAVDTCIAVHSAIDLILYLRANQVPRDELNYWRDFDNYEQCTGSIGTVVMCVEHPEPYLRAIEAATGVVILHPGLDTTEQIAQMREAENIRRSREHQTAELSREIMNNLELRLLAEFGEHDDLRAICREIRFISTVWLSLLPEFTDDSGYVDIDRSLAQLTDEEEAYWRVEYIIQRIPITLDHLMNLIVSTGHSLSLMEDL